MKTYFGTFLKNLFKIIPRFNEEALTPPNNFELVSTPIKYQEWYTPTYKW